MGRPIRVVVASVAALVLGVAPAAVGAPSDLDPGFGSGGIAVTQAGADGATSSVIRLDDGSLIVLGTATASGGGTATELARYDSSGRLATGWGDGGSGIATVPTIVAGRAFDGTAEALRPGTSDVLVAGTVVSAPDTTGDFGLVAIRTSDGSVDTGFGTDGLISTSIGDAGSDDAAALAIDPDSGEIVVGGTAAVGGADDFALAAYDRSGSLLGGFGSAGTVLTSIAGGDAQVAALALDGGRIVAAGTAQSGAVAAVARYGSDGSLDPSFGSGVPVLLPAAGGGQSSASAVVVQSDHKVLVAGTDAPAAGDCLGVTRLDADGQADASFGRGAGRADVCTGVFAAANAIASSPDGLYAAGDYVDIAGQTHLLVARLTSDGVPDPTFGNDGITSSDPTGATNDSQANALVLDGVHPVIAGEASAGVQNDFVLERLKGGTVPAITSAPTVHAGDPLFAGQELTGSAGTWAGTQPMSLTYTWLRCPGTTAADCATAQSGSEPSYRVGSADVGERMILEVTASNVAGQAIANSAATQTVAPAPVPPVNVSMPSVSGTPVVGESFTASPGQWRSSYPITFSYGWLRCPDTDLSHCVAVQSSDSPTYHIQAADGGDRMMLTVIASAIGGATKVFAPAFSGVIDSRATVAKRVAAARSAAHQTPPTVPAKKLTGRGGTTLTLTTTVPAVVVDQGSAPLGSGSSIIEQSGNGVIAAGRGNVIAAGGGNLISDKGLGSPDTPSADISSAASTRATTKRVLVLQGGHTFRKPGRGKIRLRLTPEGRALLTRYRRRAASARHHHRRIKRLRIAFTTIVGPVTPGGGVAVYGTRVITITP